jgi:hypothetical protein
LAQAKAQVKQAKAQIQQIEVALKMSQVNLSYTTITSPIDGIVVARSVDKGQTVAASLSAPTLFTIANDLTEMQVIANIDQADIGVINESNRVSFTVDAFPGQNFRGTINQIRLSPVNVQNVVTYNVVIDVRNPDLKLKPGMTANLTLTIAERQDVLKIPNAALRFRPRDMTPENIRELLQGGDTQAGAGSEAGKDAAKDAATKDAIAKDAGKGPGKSAGSGAAPQSGNAERGVARAEGQQRGMDGGERRRAGRDAGAQSGSEGGGERRAWAGGGGQPGSEGGGERRRWRDRGNQAEGQRADGQQGEMGGGRRRWAGRGDSGSDGDGGGGERRAWRNRGNQADGQQGAPDGARGGRPGGSGPGASGGERRDRAGRGASSGADGAGNRLMPATMPIQERIVWVLGPDKKPQWRRVKLGITDGTATEVIEGDLKEGETIIVGQNITDEDRPQNNNQQRPPGFGGGMPGGRGFGGGGGRGGGGRR